MNCVLFWMVMIDIIGTHRYTKVSNYDIIHWNSVWGILSVYIKLDIYLLSLWTIFPIKKTRKSNLLCWLQKSRTPMSFILYTLLGFFLDSVSSYGLRFSISFRYSWILRSYTKRSYDHSQLFHVFSISHLLHVFSIKNTYQHLLLFNVFVYT